MRLRKFMTGIFVVAMVVASGSAAMGQSGLGKEEAAKRKLRDADQAWEKVFNAKDLDKSVAFLEDDGSMLSPNEPIATGHDAVRKQFTDCFALPNLNITWHPDRAYVARSGEVGYTSGVYEMTFNDRSGKPVSDKGKYVTIWKKNADEWKVTVDIFNSDMAAGVGQ